MEIQPTIEIFNLANYTFGVKDAQPEEDASVTARLSRLQKEYELEGMRRTVEAILLVHEHGHPHILTLQIGNSFFKLPGDALKPGEDEVQGLKKRLTEKLSPDNSTEEEDWEVGECLAQWWRPNFDNYLYPYVPTHITRAKEVKKLFIVHLNEKRSFAVPRNMKLLAVPLFELFDNSVRYGQIICSVPILLSRYQWIINEKYENNDDAALNQTTE